jgi:hypothetical protein
VIDLYRSGVHPAIQVCVRRHGAVVVNRAIGHARGNGPQDAEDAGKVLATPETPFLIYSGQRPGFLTAMVPSANVVTTADELSRFYELFRRGGELDGVRIMQP